MEVVIAIIVFILIIFVALFVLGISLQIGGVGGFFIGIFKGFKNYFISLGQNIRKKHDKEEMIKCPSCKCELDPRERYCSSCGANIPEKTRQKVQPAKINYFFKDGYINLWKTIADTFWRLKKDLKDTLEEVGDNWCDFWEGITEIDGFSDVWEKISSAFLFSFFLCKFLNMLVVTTMLCAVLSLAHIVILLGVMLIVYLLLSLLLIFDILYRVLKKISSNCPNCQSHFDLPIYLCPVCGEEHTKLVPSKYGIWKRVCKCGAKIPTTFFNGRAYLEAHCPSCGTNIKDGGQHVDLCIPVVGGASAGKTCFINQAIYEIGNFADKYNLNYAYSPNGLDDYDDNINSIKNGYLPQKTNDMRLRYYQFYLTPKKERVKNLISLCDVGGEVYADSTTLGEQIGYKYANAFLMVVDPLSIKNYLKEVKETAEPSVYGCSNDSIDEITSMLITTLENMFCINSKDMLKTDVAVVFTKLDIPGLEEKIGEKAVSNYMVEHPEVISKYEAQNAVCEQFLMDYDEVNFLNSLKSKFKTIQFFAVSALGHNVNGKPFKAKNVEEPVLWIIDKTSPTIDLKSIANSQNQQKG